MRLAVRLSCFVLAATCAAGMCLAAGESIAPVGQCKAAPIIDGKPGDACWADTMEITGFVTPITTEYAVEQTSLRLCRDANALYGLVRCRQAGADKMPDGPALRDADSTWKGDSVEMFFVPKSRPGKFYQTIIDPNGGVYDAEYQNPRFQPADNLAWNSDAQVKVGKSAEEWIIEWSLPLSALGGAPADGETWDFNIVRNVTVRGEYSSWSRFLVLDWCQPAHFGKLMFVNSPVGGMTFAGLPRLTPQAAFKLDFQPAEAGKYDATITGDVIAGKTISQQADLAAGGKRTIGFDYAVAPATGAQTNSLTLEVKRDGKLLYRFLYAPEREYVAVYPGFMGVDKTFYLSPDREAKLYWDMRHSFPGGTNIATCGKVPLDYEIVFEVPEGIAIADTNAKRGDTIERDGQKLVTYALAEKFAFNAVGQRQATLTTTLKEGGKGYIFFYAKWDKGAQPRQESRFEVVHIKKTLPPARFITGSYGIYTPPLEQALRYRELGINTLSSRGYDADHIRLVNDLKKAGFFIRRGDYYFPGLKAAGAGQPWESWTDQDTDARALDINGHFIPAGDGHFQLSPSYRGRFFEKAIEDERAYLKETGVNWFAFDMENFLMPNGSVACFHPRTIEQFKAYFTQRYPDRPYIDPREFEKDPKERPEYHSIWVDFKCWMWGDFFVQLKNGLKDAVGKTTPWEGVNLSEWGLVPVMDEADRNQWMRGKEFAEVFDFIEVHAYYTVNFLVQEHEKRLAQFQKDFPGQRSKFIITPIPQRYKKEGIDDPEVPAELKCKIFEAAAFGAKGVFAWTDCMYSLASWKYWCDGIAAVKKVEDVVLDGDRIDNLTSSNEKVHAHGMKLGDRAVICVSEYLTLKPMTTKLTYTVTKKSRVVDLENDRTVARIGPRDGQFKISLDSDSRARLLLIEPETGE